MAYEHRQWAPLNVLLLIGVAVVVSYAGARTGPVYLLALVVLFIGAAFARLTTRVDRDAISWSFTFGSPAGGVAYSDLDHAEVTKTNVFEGFGIHWTMWHGWLWNVWGFRAVELFRRDGRRVTIGTDDPQGLFAAIERFRSNAP
jgi:hypothetical protein